MNNTIKELEERAELITKEIYETREAIKALKDKRTRLLSELRNIRNRRSSLLESLRKAKSELREAIKEYRSLIAEIKKLIEERRNLIDELRALRELMQSKKTTYQSLAEEVKVPLSVIKRKIEELEWYMQTHILTLEEEKQLIRKLQAYNSLLKSALSAMREKEEYLELRALYLSLKNRIAELTSKIGGLKNSLSDKRKKIEELKSITNNRLSEYMNVKSLLENKKKELEECDNNIVQLTSKLIALRQEYDNLMKSISREREKILLELKKRDVLSKLSESSKKKLTLTELKILYGVSDSEEE